MPQIHRSIDDDADFKQDVAEADFLQAGQLKQHSAQHRQRQRQNALDQQRRQKAVQNRVHQRIGFIKPARAEQRLRAEPVGKIEHIQKKQPLIKGIASPLYNILSGHNDVPFRDKMTLVYTEIHSL